MKLVVFGATGKTGQEILDQGVAAGHEMTAFVRDAGAIGDRKVRVITGDVFDEAAVTEAIRGHAAVLSALGTRPWRHVDICTGGTRVIAKAMRAAGVKRIIVVSSQGVGDSSLGTFTALGAGVVLRKSFADKLAMETELAAGDLDWIAVRPGLLSNAKPRGSWRTAVDNSLRGGKIARADLAAFMLQQLTSDEWIRKCPVLVY
jgi:putative NADH-flavin reductase